MLLKAGICPCAEKSPEKHGLNVLLALLLVGGWTK